MRVIFSVLVLFFALPALALEKGVSSFELDNGMQVVVIEDHRAPVVTHMVWYKVGAADEPPGKSGIAHFLEHLMFKGTKNAPPGEFTELISANGGSQNAFTSYDYTGYFQRIAADRLPLMMKYEADRMQNLVLTDADVLPERGVVIEERKQRTDNNPDALFGEHRRALMFRNHAYAIPVIGWMHEIEKLTRADALAFYEQHYAPNNAVLIVAGDVEPDEVRRLAETYYGPIKPSELITKRARTQEPPHRAPIRTTYRDEKVRTPYMIRSYAATHRKPGDQKEAAALVVFAELLGGSGLTSVMGRSLQLEQKLSVGQAAFYGPVSYDPTSFVLYAQPVPGVTLETLEAAVDKVLEEFLKNGPDAEHLARIKTQIRAAEIYALDDQSGRARRYGEALTAGLTVEDVQSWADVLQSVTAQDVLNAARTVLNPNASVTGYMLPEGS